MKLRDKTRRRIARTILVVFGWIPIVLLIIAAFFIRSKTCSEWVESSLANSLEMQVDFKSFERPRWDTSRFKGVTLSDAETGEPIMKCASLEVEHQHTKTPIPLLRIRIQDCKVYTDNTVSLWSFIHRSFAHRRLWKNMKVEFSAKNVSFNNASPQIIRYMKGTLIDVKDGSEGIFALFLNEQTEEGKFIELKEPVLLKIARIKNPSPATTTVTLDSTKCPLASEMISHWYTPAKRLGEKSRFHGIVTAANSGMGWNGTLAGDFDNIDLSQLFVSADKLQCAGSANISIKNAVFISQRFVSAHGRLDAQNGTITREMLDTLVSQFHLYGGGAFNRYQDATPFKQIAFEFDFENDMIALTGKCNQCTPGTIVNGELPLIREPFNPANKFPVAVFMKNFSSANDNQQYYQIAQPTANPIR